MKKKIKNSNFMNLIWFIVAILPILIFSIYTLSFLNDDEKVVTREITHAYHNMFTAFSDDEYYNNNFTIVDNYFSLTNLNDFSTENAVYYSYNLLANNTYYYYIYTDRLMTFNEIYFYFDNDYSIDFNISSTHFYSGNFTLNENSSLCAFWLNGIENATLNANLKIFVFSQELPITSEIMNNSNMNDILISNTETYNLYNNYDDFLQMYELSWFGSGFIANIFITLLSYFSISSIYANLLCYYLEYLVLTMLLHLAFDFLLLVPNICHKFLDKIGGERE